MWKPAIANSPLYENLHNVGNPFDGMAIDDASFLDEKEARENCLRCGRSRKWFCYDCRLPLASLEQSFPCVELPFTVDIIKHGKELDGKSTGVQAAILSKQVNLYTYPDIEPYEDPDKVLVIFPCDRSFDDVCQEASGKASLEDCRLCHGKHVKFPFDRVLLVDSTWSQTKRINLDERIARAGLTGRDSVFWRPQRGRNLEYLATIEALHEICRRWLAVQNCPEATKVDNILFFFRYFHDKITSRYRTLLKGPDI